LALDDPSLLANLGETIAEIGSHKVDRMLP
jgi:hypothetical protein